jgi:hypothetical protein
MTRPAGDDPTWERAALRMARARSEGLWIVDADAREPTDRFSD